MTEKTPTRKQLAAALQITVRRVAQLKALGMPVSSIAAAQGWRADREHGDSSAEALRRERVQLVRLQRKKAQLEFDAMRGELLSKEQIASRDRRLAWGLRARLLKLENDLPPLLEGLEAVAIHKICRESIRAAMSDLHDELRYCWPTDAEIQAFIASRKKPLATQPLSAESHE